MPVPTPAAFEVRPQRVALPAANDVQVVDVVGALPALRRDDTAPSASSAS